MNAPSPREGFFVRLTALANMCSFELSKEIVGMYERGLAAFGYEKLNQALDQIIQNRRSREAFPAIRDIREAVAPEADPEAEAIECVGRIVQAISRIGPYRTAEARGFVGELGWLVVVREGGWEKVCQILTDQNIGTLKAQWKQTAIAQFKRARSGLTGAPELPSPDGKVTGPAVDVLKFLPKIPPGGAA